MQLQGNFLDYFLVFGSGVLVSFTPCVYPVMPLTASFIAGFNVEQKKRKGFALSLLYVLGLAITYCSLGVFAALTGGLFGQVQNTPTVFIGVACILVFFSLVMFDVVSIPTFGFHVKRDDERKDFWAIVVCGMASGFIVGACTAPVLGTLLLYIASKQDVVRGISLMFVFSYGVGASLILVGTFTGILSKLPKSGVWLLRVKQLCGCVLFGAAVYFLIKAYQLLF